MSTKVLLTIDEGLKNEAIKLAKDSGLSLSAFIRLSLTERIRKSKRITGLDRAILDIEQDNMTSYDSNEYLSIVDDMVKNANG